MNAATATLVRSLRAHAVEDVELALVLGSGLGGFADRIERPLSIPYADLDGLPQSGVPGHAGRLVVGEIRGVRVLVQQGRVHLYEGWNELEVSRAVRAFAAIGVRGIVLTNAAGGIRAGFRPGTLMRIVDHLNLQGSTPLGRTERGFGCPWDRGFGQALDRAARSAGIELQQGVYAGLLGPTYETPAEVELLQSIGADAVGMSTIAEALAAHAAGMKVAGVSCITNLAAGLSKGPLSHAEVLEVGQRTAHGFCALLEHAVPELARELSGRV